MRGHVTQSHSPTHWTRPRDIGSFVGSVFKSLLCEKCFDVQGVEVLKGTTKYREHVGTGQASQSRPPMAFVRVA